MTDFVRANLRLGVCVANEGFSTAREIAAQAPGDDLASWFWTMLEAGTYVMGVSLVALAMFAAVSTIGWLFFLRAPRKHLKRTKSMKFEIGQPVSAAYDSKITGQLDATATDPTGLTLWRVDDHWFDELSLVRL